MPENKRQHFVPRHYLRQFRVDESERIAIATLEPFRFIGPGAIGGQCQENNFYGKDGKLDSIHSETEATVAPVLVNVVLKQDFDPKELCVLKMLAVSLHLRTRKAEKSAKVFPNYAAHKIINNAIERGRLPAPPGGIFTEEMGDIDGMTGLLMEMELPCYMEMMRLNGKMLHASEGSNFITSDNPVVILNQFCSGADPHRCFAGFSKAGFQLLMPISPNLCLFFYDSKIYRIGNRRERCVQISRQDVEIVNALQVQFSENCLYFHDINMQREVERLVTRYAKFRAPIRDALRVIPGEFENEELTIARNQFGRLPASWAFCRHLRHIKFKPGDARDPAWTALIECLMRDIDQNPNGDDISVRIERILA